MTTGDYRAYRKCYTNITYSYVVDGDPSPLADEIIRKTTEKEVWSKPMFTDVMLNHPEIELYFFKDESDNILGVTSMELDQANHTCYIGEFIVYTRRQGHGTEFFNLIMEYILEKKKFIKRFEIRCPDTLAGARIFWTKKGFRPMLRKKEFLEKPLKRKR